MREYKVEVTRDGRWWMIDVPEIAQITQARRLDEIEDMARSLIAISTETPLTEVAIKVTSIAVADLGDIAARAHSIVEHRERAAHELEKAQRDTATYAAALMRAGVTVRDAGTLLDLSPQRVSQLAQVKAS
ncbi:hypothetical protein AWC29_01860 [Mycobacterium triplex]|uniref:HicB family toxin-antitoxin system n=2 Tax=Mycobacterium triplex TaxID=47839 RepID=A0A024JXY3_9MYCO|nr:hypothetical protein [Mycobacterium triplex]ORX00718.1 hypothetical protein AWC29_01860 [Mycobacterium triplex]CDO88103.1 hypothetical protein BN973_02462 [Mycobacterium triplex]